MAKVVEQTAVLFLKSSTLLLKFAPPKKDEFAKLLLASAKTGAAVSIRIDEEGNVIVEELKKERVPPWLAAQIMERLRQKKKRLTH